MGLEVIVICKASVGYDLQRGGILLFDCMSFRHCPYEQRGFYTNRRKCSGEERLEVLHWTPLLQSCTAAIKV